MAAMKIAHCHTRRAVITFFTAENFLRTDIYRPEKAVYEDDWEDGSIVLLSVLMYVTAMRTLHHSAQPQISISNMTARRNQDSESTVHHNKVTNWHHTTWHHELLSRNQARRRDRSSLVSDEGKTVGKRGSRQQEADFYCVGLMKLSEMCNTMGPSQTLPVFCEISPFCFQFCLPVMPLRIQ
jgi:hypothetical protein